MSGYPHQSSFHHHPFILKSCPSIAIVVHQWKPFDISILQFANCWLEANLPTIRLPSLSHLCGQFWSCLGQAIEQHRQQGLESGTSQRRGKICRRPWGKREQKDVRTQSTFKSTSIALSLSIAIWFSSARLKAIRWPSHINQPALRLAASQVKFLVEKIRERDIYIFIIIIYIYIWEKGTQTIVNW